MTPVFPRALYLDDLPDTQLRPILCDEILDLKTMSLDISTFCNMAKEEFPDISLPEFSNYPDEIDQILKRLTNSHLFVGVVGEFSSGKSSFINAIINKPLLLTDVLPCTTKKPVLLANNPVNSIFILSRTGTIRQIGTNHIFHVCAAEDIFVVAGELLEIKELKGWHDNSCNFMEDLNKTSETGHISMVLADMATAGEDLVWVDTPGLGSLDEQLSQETMEIGCNCDALLVLTNLETPLSKTLLADIMEMSGHIPQICVFVGTHLDAIARKDMPKIKNFFENRLYEHTGNSPKFYFVSSLYPESDTCNESGDMNYCLQPIHKWLKEHHIGLQSIQACRKVLGLTANLKNYLENLHQCMKPRKLQVNPTANKAPDLDGVRQKQLHDFRLAVEKSCSLAEDITREEIKKCAYNISNEIYSLEEITQLRNYLKKDLERSLSSLYPDISSKIIESVVKPLVKYAEDINTSYLLDTGVGCDGSKYSFGSYNDNSRYRILRESKFEELENIVPEWNEKLWQGGGIAAGICAATIIPGIGWLAGGILVASGLLMGGFIRSKEKERNQYLQKLDDYFSQLMLELPQRVSRHVEYTGARLTSALESSLLKISKIALVEKKHKIVINTQKFHQFAEQSEIYWNCISVLENNIKLILDRFKTFI